MKSKWCQKALLYLIVSIVMILYAYPLLYTLSTSLKSQADYLKDPIGFVRNIRWQNYLDAWKAAKLGKTVANSLMYSAITTIVSITLALFLSYPIARKYHKWCRLIYIAFLIGMFLPDPTIPRWQIIFKAGLYNTRLGYILTMVGGGGITLLMFCSYIKSIPKEIDEAAIMDGCGYITFVFRILLPLIKPAVVSMTVLRAISCWNDVLSSILYLSDEKYFPITRGLYVFKGVYSSNVPQLSAALVLIAVPMIILYIFLQRYIVEGIVAGGVKS